MSTDIGISGANCGQQYAIVNGDVRTEYHAPSEPRPGPTIIIPFSRDERFVDREAATGSGTILDLVHQKCKRLCSRTALVGIGGVGKSQLAIEYAYRVREQSPERWVFWIRASNTVQFEQSVQEIADYVEPNSRKEPQADTLKLVRDWLRNPANGPWTIILDNVDDASVLTSPIADTRQSRLSYIPPCDHGSVLVTSRDREAALKIVEYEDVITVEPMNAKDADTLLRTKLSREIADDTGVPELVKALEYIPLAIVQAAACITQSWPQISVQQYLRDYKASDERKIGLLSVEGGGASSRS